MRISACALSVALVAVVVLSACTPAPDPVGRVVVEPARIDLPYPGFSTLHLRFEPSAPLAAVVGEPHVFVHVLQAPGAVIRTFDHPLPGSWTPGEPLDYSIPLYQSALGPPLAPGSYSLSVGLYDAEGKRWALEADGEEVDSGEYVLAQVVVPEAAGEEPMFYFSAAWGPIEGGTDGQILARRSLPGPGEIRVGPLTRPGTVWMSAHVPVLDGPDLRLELAAGAERPVVIVRSDCSGVEVCVSGEGGHEIEVPVLPPSRATASAASPSSRTSTWSRCPASPNAR